MLRRELDKFRARYPDDSEFTSLQADLRTTFTATETALSQHLSDTP